MRVLGNEPNYTNFEFAYPRGLGSNWYTINDWLEPRKKWRIKTVYNEVIRHPFIRRFFYTVVVYDSEGMLISPKRFGDSVLIIPNGTPPYTVYFNPVWDPIDNDPPIWELGVPSRSIDDLLKQNIPWYGLEHYDEYLNAVNVTGIFTVDIGGTMVLGITDQKYERMDNPNPLRVSQYVLSIRKGEIVLVAPKDALESAFTLYPRIVSIRHDGADYIDYGIITRVRIEPLGRNKRITINYVGIDEFFDLDVKDLETASLSLRNILDPNSSSKEEDILHKLLRAAGIPGTHTIDGETRYSLFWTVKPPRGPGLPEDEAIARYYNTMSGSLFDAIRSLAEANMLRAVPKPDGGLHFEPIVPFYGYTIDKFFDGTVPVQFFCVDDKGYYVLDPKLELTDFVLDTTSIFAEIEVEGYSNTVTADFIQTYGRFVTVSGQEREYVEIDSGLWGNAYAAFESYADSQKINGKYDDETQVHPNNTRGFRFRVIENGSPKAKYYPVLWARAKGIDPYSKENFSYESGDANWWVDFKQAIDVDMKEGLIDTTGVNSLADELISRGFDASSVNMEKHKAIAGFWATPERNLIGACLGDPLFRMKWKVVDVDMATISIKPLRAGPDDLYAPFWFPHFHTEFISRYKSLFARGNKVVQNPFITEIGDPDFAVQYKQWSYPVKNGRTYGELLYTTVDANAKHLATWLTFEEFLKSRRARIRYYGFPRWRPRGFVAIAVKPSIGTIVEKYDLFWIGEDVSISMEFGKEFYTEAEAYFIARFYRPVGSSRWYVNYVPPESPLVDDGYEGQASSTYISKDRYEEIINSKYSRVGSSRNLPPRDDITKFTNDNNALISVEVDEASTTVELYWIE